MFNGQQKLQRHTPTRLLVGERQTIVQHFLKKAQIPMNASTRLCDCSGVDLQMNGRTENFTGVLKHMRHTQYPMTGIFFIRLRHESQQSDKTPLLFSLA